jgi:hypothetical protein
MRRASNKAVLVFSSIVMLSMACSLGSGVLSGVDAITSGTEAPATSAAAAATMAVPTAAPTVVPPTPTIEVVHVKLPGTPGTADRYLEDFDSSTFGPEHRTGGGDEFDVNRFERPFTAQQMDYLPMIDLKRVEVDADSTWYYWTLFLKGDAVTTGSDTRYAVEIDTDLDGRGDFLLQAVSPIGSDWTSQGVRVYDDSDNTVGGATPVAPDATKVTTTGYDEIIYDQGVGEDADTAFVRVSPGSPSVVEFALKQSFLNDKGGFLWSAWAAQDKLGPAYYDYNDNFTLAEAGSPLTGSDYPVKSIAAVDSTCRMPFGFSPTGSEAGLCVIPGRVRNCTPHPILMKPGDKELKPFFEASGSILNNVAPGVYKFYDMSVQYTLVLTATLRPGGQIDITKTGLGDSYPCK